MSANRVIKRLAGEIGTKEYPPGSNRVKYSEEYGLIGAWCVMFLWWGFRQEGYGADVFPNTASTGVNFHGLMQWAKANGRWHTNPKRGDIVVFSFSHVGIVTKVYGRYDVKTIEGNTDASGSRTGGQVMRKRRRGAILGYFRPDYSGATGATKNTGGIDGMAYDSAPLDGARVLPGDAQWRTLKWDKGDKSGYAMAVGAKPYAVTVYLDFAEAAKETSGQLKLVEVEPNPFPGTLSRGSSGADVRRLQKEIGAAVDGEFGPNTESALKDYERKHDMKVDGVVGPTQWGRMFPSRVFEDDVPQVFEFTCEPGKGRTFETPTMIGYLADGRHLRACVKLIDGDAKLRNAAFRILA